MAAWVGRKRRGTTGVPWWKPIIVTQQHGGTISVDSRVSEFTEFTIRLPRAGQA
jgi:hypothetical protein